MLYMFIITIVTIIILKSVMEFKLLVNILCLIRKCLCWRHMRALKYIVISHRTHILQAKGIYLIMNFD